MVLFGGQSSEYEVSLQSAYGILTNIDKNLFTPVPVGITKNGEWFLYSGDYENIKKDIWQIDKDNCFHCALIPSRILQIFRPEDIGGHKQILIDAVFPAVHGKNCEDGQLQGFLHICGTPFVGCDCETSAVGMDKDFTKIIVKTLAIKVAPSVTISDIKNIPYKKIDKFAFPLFVKPSRSGSSVGVSKVKNIDELLPAIEKALKEDNKVLIEKAVIGSEIEVAVLSDKDGNVITSPPAEILSGAEFYDYDAKYSKNSKYTYNIPANLSEKISKKVRFYAEKIFKILGGKGIARVDFFVNSDTIVFNEINTLPGFTPISMYPKLMQAVGISYSELITKLVENIE